MEEILEKVLNTIEKYKLINPKERILLSVSGGIDSMTMLLIFTKIKDALEIEIGVATFNHGIREESKEEAKLVKNYCEQLGIPFFYGEGDAIKEHMEKKKNLEDAARFLRLNFLSEVRERNNYQKIALAHNKNDFAETFLMHLFKGSGIQGLTSMLGVEKYIIRPLIEISREEIEQYAKENNVPYAIDLTNYNLSYERNRLRYQIIPLVNSVYGNILDHLVNLGDILLFEDEFLSKVTTIESKAIKYGEDEFSTLIFNQLPLAIKRRILKEILGEHGNFERINNIINFLGSERGKRLSVGKDLFVSKTKNTFYLEHSTPFSLKFEYEISVPGETLIHEIGMKIVSEIVEPSLQLDFKTKNLAIFDFEKINFPIKLRFRQEGDIIELEKGHKKLQDVFVDMKIRKDLRHKIPLIVDNKNQILWICGIKRSAIARVSKSTKKALLLRVIPIK